MHSVLKYLGTVAAVFLTVNLVPGISYTGGPSTGAATTGGWVTILLVALAWSVIAIVIKPVLGILTLPITIVTFGLFSLVLNAFLFYAMSWIVPGFIVAGFWSALLGALALSILTWLIHKIL
ncbi:MAG: phage holin family protein [bacterium]|nr:phage holin family protein [bacterium]